MPADSDAHGNSGGEEAAPVPVRRSEVARELLREHPEFEEPHLLEDDETIPPRPEEEIADAD